MTQTIPKLGHFTRHNLARLLAANAATLDASRLAAAWAITLVPVQLGMTWPDIRASVLAGRAILTDGRVMLRYRDVPARFDGVVRASAPNISARGARIAFVAFWTDEQYPSAEIQGVMIWRQQDLAAVESGTTDVLTVAIQRPPEQAYAARPGGLRPTGIIAGWRLSTLMPCTWNRTAAVAIASIPNVGRL